MDGLHIALMPISARSNSGKIPESLPARVVEQNFTRFAADEVRIAHQRLVGRARGGPLETWCFVRFYLASVQLRI